MKNLYLGFHLLIWTFSMQGSFARYHQTTDRNSLKCKDLPQCLRSCFLKGYAGGFCYQNDCICYDEPSFDSNYDLGISEKTKELKRNHISQQLRKKRQYPYQDYGSYLPSSYSPYDYAVLPEYGLPQKPSQKTPSNGITQPAVPLKIGSGTPSSSLYYSYPQPWNSYSGFYDSGPTKKQVPVIPQLPPQVRNYPSSTGGSNQQKISNLVPKYAQQKQPTVSSSQQTPNAGSQQGSGSTVSKIPFYGKQQVPYYGLPSYASQQQIPSYASQQQIPSYASQQQIPSYASQQQIPSYASQQQIPVNYLQTQKIPQTMASSDATLPGLLDSLAPVPNLPADYLFNPALYPEGYPFWYYNPYYSPYWPFYPNPYDYGYGVDPPFRAYTGSPYGLYNPNRLGTMSGSEHALAHSEAETESMKKTQTKQTTGSLAMKTTTAAGSVEGAGEVKSDKLTTTLLDKSRALGHSEAHKFTD